jgi:aspartate/tyrosine/aromatic aminotransferase
MRAITKLLTDPALAKSSDAERDELKKLLGARVAAFNEAAKAKGLVYPRYEGGFFVTVFTDDAHDRALRMKEKGVFVVPAKGALRVALCSVAEKDVPRLVEALAE